MKFLQNLTPARRVLILLGSMAVAAGTVLGGIFGVRALRNKHVSETPAQVDTLESAE